MSKTFNWNDNVFLDDVLKSLMWIVDIQVVRDLWVRLEREVGKEVALKLFVDWAGPNINIATYMADDTNRKRWMLNAAEYIAKNKLPIAVKVDVQA